jgi:uncharacterized membrane protein
MKDKRPAPKARRTKDRQSSSMLERIARAHARLWLSVVLGCATFVLLTAFMKDWLLATRLLVSWDIGVLSYVVAAATMMARAPVDHIRRRAAMHDEGAFAILVLTVGVAIASLVAIFAELAAADRAEPGYWLRVALAIVTVVLSWTFTHTIYALHYAYDYYGEGERSEGLKFPDDGQPDYWDFVYFSFVVGMTFQVSDVAVTNKWIRRVVVVHGAVSFLFNTAILALMVNMAASLL